MRTHILTNDTAKDILLKQFYVTPYTTELSPEAYYDFM